MVKLLPEPINVPVHEPEYQLRIIPLPPVKLKVILEKSPAQNIW